MVARKEGKIEDKENKCEGEVEVTHNMMLIIYIGKFPQVRPNRCD